VTAHVAIAWGLAWSATGSRWRAGAALLLPPLAPYWALRAKMWLRAAVWILAALVYGVARFAQHA
jgi:hypothetical protein